MSNRRINERNLDMCKYLTFSSIIINKYDYILKTLLYSYKSK